MPVIQYTRWNGTLVLVDVDHVTPASRRKLLITAHAADFDQLSRALDLVQERERELIASVTPEQAAISWGSYAWFRYNGGDLPACTIYGQVHTHAEACRDEDAATIGYITDAYKAGWLTGRWYSSVEPEGEPGFNHRAHLHPLTAAQFGAARDAGWPDKPPAG